MIFINRKLLKEHMNGNYNPILNEIISNDGVDMFQSES